jgi:SAM-dependent methyltransferase
LCAVDPAKAQIDYVSNGPLARRADFRLAEAQALPFPDGTFDIAASALVINFIPDRLRGLAEMSRVVRPGGLVAGYVWDFAGEHGPNQPIRSGMVQIGAEVRRQSGAEATSTAALNSLFGQAGFEEIETQAIDVSLDFPSFDDYWRAQTPRLHPIAKTIAGLSEPDRAKLVDLVKAEVTRHPNGSICCVARANTIKGRVPG